MALIHPPARKNPFFPSPLKALTGLFFVILPMAVSAMIIVYPNVRARTMYTSRKMPPPYFAAKYGNRQMFPRPTDAPADERTKPSFPEKLLLFCSM